MKLYILLFLLIYSCDKDIDDEPTQSEYLGISLKTTEQYQTIHGFGASDAWSCQFVGKNWPSDKKEAIANYLFSTNINADGLPEGIGLSIWRFNIGAGSAEQGSGSGIYDEWRRAESFLQLDGNYNWNNQQGQRWFLGAAKQRGVETFIGFVNSPPVYLTRNNKAYSSGGSNANIASENYLAFADYLTDIVSQLSTSDGIDIDYISPVNETQWDWDNSGQEGSPWMNSEIAAFTRVLNQSFKNQSLNTKIDLPEAAQINFLYENSNRSGRGTQIETFFNPISTHYVGDLENIEFSVSGHSYYSTWNTDYFIDSRKELAFKLNEYPNLEYSMSEYCLLENNSEINGNGRDLGMDPALYMARVIHADLTVAGASSWQWWLAVSPYNYKDGLVYIDKNKNNGEIYDSKMLWALGNYSLFIRPGMKRIGVTRSDQRSIEQNLGGVMISSYINPENEKTVTVAINYGNSNIPMKIDINSKLVNCTMYRTSDGNEDLKNVGIVNFDEPVNLAPRSITTFVEN
jgi:O-glycosyl hydrolase